MKRFLSFLLSVMMLLGLAVPALAAVPADDQAALDQALSDITLQVKKTLDVDDGYTDFYGDYNDGLRPSWRLNWSDDARSLSVEVSPDGTVLDVYRRIDGDSADRFYGFDPAFPPLTLAEAEEQAADWLTRLMGPGETGRIDDVRTYLGANGYYRFSGTVELNGLPSPISFSMEIDGNGLSSYYRSDNYNGYVGDIPSNTPVISMEVGEKSLFKTVSMEIYYISDREGNARLRYVPVGPYTVVDAATGEAVDMDALYASFGYGSGQGTNYAVTMESAADAGGVDAPAAALTEVELSSIASYAGVLDQTAIDAALRAMDALGLDDFTVQRCSYAMDEQTGDVTASLRYTAEMKSDELYGYSREEFDQYQTWGDSLTIYKYITIDAKTGEIMDVSTSYPLWERDEAGDLSDGALQRAAEDFLVQAAPDIFAETAKCTLTGYDEDGGLTYARTHDGYFFPENYLYVEINPAAGTVDSFHCVWDEDVTFAPSAGIVDKDAAWAAYAGALEVELGYVAWPVDIEEDPDLYARYLEWGYTFVETLRLGYYYGGTEEVEGVDALTGEAVMEADGNGTYVYTDLAGVAEGEMIETLGLAGIGFDGGLFRPRETLTQRDALTLLVQAAGRRTGDWDDETLQSEAVSQGFIRTEDWSPEAVVTRMEMARMLIGASRYGDAAALLGDDGGYGAIARALGLDVTAPDTPLTRAEGAEMLYIFMSR